MFPRETGHNNNISSSCDRGRPQCRVYQQQLLRGATDNDNTAAAAAAAARSDPRSGTTEIPSVPW